MIDNGYGNADEVQKYGITELLDKQDLSQVIGLTNLKYVCGYWSNQPKLIDISPLAHLTNLTELDLWYNQISDLTPLAHLTNLTELALNGNPIPKRQIDWLRKQLPDCTIYS